ncbi:MAG: hypothetical protein GY810_10955 [Aureispira sp.]|nr:hypothetical protein [Aureispira sp.]
MMDSFLSFESIMFLAAFLISLLGFFLLGRRFRYAWLILMIEPLWLIGYYSFDILQAFSISWVSYYYIIESTPVVLFLAKIIILGYGYSCWKNANIINYSPTHKRTDILDDINVQHTTVATQQLSSQTIMVPITFGIIGVACLAFLKSFFFAHLGYGLNFYTMAFSLLEIGLLLGFYLLGKQYIEGWLVIIFVTLGYQFIWGFSFHWTIFYPILQIGISIWGYIEWKKHIPHSN